VIKTAKTRVTIIGKSERGLRFLKLALYAGKELKNPTENKDSVKF